MLTAIAIDDEPQALEVVQMHASKVPFLELKASFTNAFEAISYLQNNKVDLLFLDIKMPDISGIEFIGCLQAVPMVIFTTAYSQYAVKGFELSAIDYLLKPFSLARFTKACNKALEHKNLRHKEPDKYIFVKTGHEEEKVLLEEILYIEAEGNYLTFVLENRKLLSRQTMGDILKVLPPEQFARVHRSYTIAIDKIEKIGRQEIVIAGKAIPIGVSYEEKAEEIRQKLNRR
jgi:DNA-binding LytR/AlgR family response regulator